MCVCVPPVPAKGLELRALSRLGKEYPPGFQQHAEDTALKATCADQLPRAGLGHFHCHEDQSRITEKEQVKAEQQGSAHLRTFTNEGILHTIPHTWLYFHF